MKNKLLLIDGSSVLTTSFFGVGFPREYFGIKGNDPQSEEKRINLLDEKLMKTSDGRFTNAVFGMSKTLLNIIHKQKPTHIAVCWDVNRTSLERKKKFDGYKAHRKQTSGHLSSQFALMQEVLQMMGIPSFKLEGHEADDIIGTLARNHASEETMVYVLTKDQDALQLIDERTRVWLVTSKSKRLYEERGLNVKDFNVPDGTFEFSHITFKEEYGINPIQLIDQKALEGDSSDNIPGVKNVGPATILPLLNEFGTVEGIYEYIENTPEPEAKKFMKDSLGINRSPIANLLAESDTELVGKKAATLSKELATIQTELAEFTDTALGDMALTYNKEKTLHVFKKLEFKSLYSKV